MKKIAISIGDLNGIGIQLALENHAAVARMVAPVYCIDARMLSAAADRLGVSVPDDFVTVAPFADPFTIQPGTVDTMSGTYSYASFVHAVALARNGVVDAVVTLPIHKKAWALAGITYTGHTDALRDFFDAKAMMMLGCPEMYVALYTEHIPLRAVPDRIQEADLTRFLVDFYRTAGPQSPVAVLGLNPHAGDDGILGDEEQIIQAAIHHANSTIGGSAKVFVGPLVPDVAFVPHVRRRYTHYVAMYHDQGLAPLKALYFDAAINISLNLPILRTSVDHGTAFDIAYRGSSLNHTSYLNAIRYVAAHTLSK